MSVVKKNIIANVIGKGFAALLSLVFVPVYLKYLGVEAYAIVAIYATLQSVCMIADIGLTGAFTREIARLSAIEDSAQNMCDLCRTFETIFLGIGLIVVFIVIALSGVIAEYWVNAENLSNATVANSIVLIGAGIGLQFLFAVYQGGLLGLQCQVHLNVLLLSMGVLRGVGAILILNYVETSIISFLSWQVLVNVIQLLSGFCLIWRNLPGFSQKSHFQLTLIKPLWRFAIGTAGITFTGIVLTQSDKLILTKILPLEMFGYYSIASLVSSIPYMIAMPFSNAIYPRFTQLVSAGNIVELTDLYHKACQVLAVLLFPMGLIVCFFSKELIFLWTGNMETAQNTYVIASILTVGTTLMGVMVIPFALQLAFAWTRLGFYLNIISVILLIPTMIFFVSIYGVLGACFTGVALYTFQIFGMIHFMHKRILQGEKWKWYVDDIGKPLLSSVVIIFFAKQYISNTVSLNLLIISLISVFTIAVFVSAMCATHIRKVIFEKISARQ